MGLTIGRQTAQKAVGALGVLIAGAIALVSLWSRRQEQAIAEPDDRDLEARLHSYAREVARDPEHARWKERVRQELASGIPEDQLVGREELLAMKRALRQTS